MEINISTNVAQSSSQFGGTGTIASSSVSTSGPKICKFATKSGFVIPKNKLSGSLVPIFRGVEKGTEDSKEGEISKQMKRKTLCGPDLTQDTSVRKVRALAYQTRVDQINQQQSEGSFESTENQHMSLDDEKSKLLEIEKREAIGEILKLNPLYKAPADYKPVMKEDKVPIPIKDHPGFNFIGLIFGTIQKRLEKETGAKIQIYGRKANTEDEVEVTSYDENEKCDAYVELYVHVSADTYEKVDAAVSLIKLLVTPVTINVSSTKASSENENKNENENTVGVSHSTTPSSEASALVNQQSVGPAQSVPPQVNFEQYRGPWSNPSVQPVHASSAQPLSNNMGPSRPIMQQQYGGPHSPSLPRNPPMPFFQSTGPHPPPWSPINQPSFINGHRPQPNSSDFPFLPQRPQMMQPPQHAMNMSNHPHNVNQMSQPRVQMANNNFPGNSSHPIRVPHINPTLPRNFDMAPPIHNHVTPFPPPRGGNQMHFQQNFPAPPNQQPRNLMPQNQQLFVRPGNFSRVEQVYDPFSPTSLSFNPRHGGGGENFQKQENDPEYDDLMASVGVK